MTDFVIDWQREARTGIAEAVLCEGKTVSQIEAILADAGDRALLLTRLDVEQFDVLRPETRTALDYHPLSRTAFHGNIRPAVLRGPCVVCAGTSDLRVAHEVVRSLAFAGYGACLIADVGVAGLWRLFERLDEIRSHEVVIAVAGMEGALFSVLAGLLPTPVIAVPSSVGYGVAAGGRTALHSALATCAAGLTCVNIDNGFGAACAALRILRANQLPSGDPTKCKRSSDHV